MSEACCIGSKCYFLSLDIEEQSLNFFLSSGLVLKTLHIFSYFIYIFIHYSQYEIYIMAAAIHPY